MRYEGRPGLSPAIAALIARGDIAKDDVILDVGCGKGTDCLLLARWGFKRVVGVDPDAGAIRIARSRATRLRLGRRVRFIAGDVEDLPPDLAHKGVDVVLHTLVGNNLESEHHAHFAAIARALRPKGMLVMSIRTFRHEENAKPGAVPPVPGMRRYFELTPSFSSHLAEHGDYEPPFAPVAIWIGKPRRR